jgi:hypothetical protein
MTCAKAVENHGGMRITNHVLWTACGLEKSSKKMRRGSCAVLRRGSRNAVTVRNGHCPGGDSGTWEEQGDLSLTRVPGSGGRRVRAGKARQLADLMRRGQARSPASHTWRGPCLILPDTSALPRTDTPADILTPTAGSPGLHCAGAAPRPTQPRCRPVRTSAPSSVSGYPPKSRPETRPGEGRPGGAGAPGHAGRRDQTGQASLR